MDFSLGNALTAAYKRAGGKNPHLLKKSDSDWHSRRVNSDFATDEDLDLLIDAIEGDEKLRDSPEDRRNLRKLKSILDLRDGVTKKIINLEVMADALREFLSPLPNRWVFTEEDGQYVQWFVERVEFHPATQHQGYWSPAHTDLSLKAKYRGALEKKTIEIHREDLGKGMTPAQLMSVLNIAIETDELRIAYYEEMEKYREICRLSGEQFLGSGMTSTGHTHR